MRKIRIRKGESSRKERVKTTTGSIHDSQKKSLQRSRGSAKEIQER